MVCRNLLVFDNKLVTSWIKGFIKTTKHLGAHQALSPYIELESMVSRAKYLTSSRYPMAYRKVGTKPQIASIRFCKREIVVIISPVASTIPSNTSLHARTLLWSS